MIQEKHDELGKLVQTLKFVEEYVETITVLATEHDVTALLGQVLQSARRFTNSDAGRVYLLDVTKSRLELTLSQWDDTRTTSDWYQTRELHLDPSMSDDAENRAINSSDPLYYAVVTGSTVLIDHVYEHAGLNLDYVIKHDQQHNVKTQSMLVVPLRDHNNQTIGLLELINAKDAADRRYVSFKPLESLVTAFAAQAAVAINNAQLIDTNAKLIDILDRENRALEEENQRLRDNKKTSHDYAIIGESKAMTDVFSLMDKAVDSIVTVLVRGETGTGKEIFAKAIHDHGDRGNKELVTQNCAALPEQLLESELFGYKKGAFTGATAEKKGLFDVANGGTLFLDEIGDMPLQLQSKLLRVLQEGEIRPLGATVSHKVDVRIIAATHCDLEEKIRKGEFREDLYFRLSVFPISLPPLRKRGNDIKMLVQHFTDIYTKQYQKTISGIAPIALDMMLAYRFPGNVRELQNVIERAVLLVDDQATIMPEHLTEQIIMDSRSILEQCSVAPTSVNSNNNVELRVAGEVFPIVDIPHQHNSLKEAVNFYEIAVINQHLKANNWNQTRAAETLQVPRRTLIDKMNRLSITVPKRKKRISTIAQSNSMV
ncbi:MAG: sigma-54-dependent Fis family transcriptional regulator [Moraxellaceae bacterium]|nr:MAG: sigma-54-dependent Fis family transcriptional regulator [Moraxellaceae bacterium]